MKEKRKGKVVLRASSPVLKILVIVLILFSTATLVALNWVHGAIQAETEEMRGEAAALEHANEDLQGKIDNYDAVNSVRQIAREELGLVDPDDILIDVNPAE